MDKLNDIQKQAVLSTEKNILVIAGAGSGKTTVLSKRIQKLVESGVETRHILAITFTNKAAAEMRERINVGGVMIKTFHGLGLLIIRQNLEYISYLKEDFAIIDRQDQKRIIKHLFNKDSTYKPNEILAAVTYAKSNSVIKSNLHLNALETMQEYVLKYEEYTKKNNSIDFDDLLLLSNELLSENIISSRYKYLHILIDEYQDTSDIQTAMINKIIKDKTNTFYVGDVDQAIYGWRGANVGNILSLEKKGYTIIKLEQNYRSTAKILDGANKLIANNQVRYDKHLWTSKQGGSNISYKECEDKTDEMSVILRELDFLLQLGPSDTNALLYRFNYQSKAIEETLVKNNIQYIMYNGLRFYERMEVKDVIAYIKLLINHNDNNSFLRVVNTPKRKIGDVTIKKIADSAELNNISYYSAASLMNFKGLNEFFSVINKYSSLILEDFDKYFEMYLEEIGYMNFLRTYDEMFEERCQNITELKESMSNAMSEEQSLNEYLNELVLFENAEKTDDAKVVLSTIHGVKGLEFDNVFLVDCNENILPPRSALEDNEQLEEERRVVYVAITRARKKLFCSYVTRDHYYDYLKPSRFLYEMGMEKKKKGFTIF